MTCRKLAENWQKTVRNRTEKQRQDPLDELMDELNALDPGDYEGLAVLARRLRELWEAEGLAISAVEEALARGSPPDHEGGGGL